MRIFDKMKHELNEFEDKKFWKQVNKDNEVPAIYSTEDDLLLNKIQNRFFQTLKYIKEFNPKLSKSYFSDNYVLFILKDYPLNETKIKAIINHVDRIENNNSNDFIFKTTNKELEWKVIQSIKTITNEDNKIIFLYDIWCCFEINGKHLEDYSPVNTLAKLQTLYPFDKVGDMDSIPDDFEKKMSTDIEYQETLRQIQELKKFGIKSLSNDEIGIIYKLLGK
jgi:predicted ribosome-associated RNA-binding protein Tma20